MSDNTAPAPVAPAQFVPGSTLTLTDAVEVANAVDLAAKYSAAKRAEREANAAAKAATAALVAVAGPHQYIVDAYGQPIVSVPQSSRSTISVEDVRILCGDDVADALLNTTYFRQVRK